MENFKNSTQPINKIFIEQIEQVIDLLDQTTQKYNANRLVVTKEIIEVYKYTFISRLLMFRKLNKDAWVSDCEVPQSFIIELETLINILNANLQNSIHINSDRLIDIINDYKFIEYLEAFYNLRLVKRLHDDTIDCIINDWDSVAYKAAIDALREHVNNIKNIPHGDMILFGQVMSILNQECDKYRRAIKEEGNPSNLLISVSDLNDDLYELLKYEGSDIIKSKAFYELVKKQLAYSLLVDDITYITHDYFTINKQSDELTASWELTTAKVNMLLLETPDNVKEIVELYLESVVEIAAMFKKLN